MDEFQNKLIVKEEVYQNGLFPKVPKVGKHGSAYILTGGCNDDIVVNEYTTPKEIRQGKYTNLVEISTHPYMKEIRFCSPSKDTHYSFDVYVKAVIQVVDPIIFYDNRNLDVDGYFNNLFSLDVKKITREYSILNYNGMDEDLMQKLSSYNTIDESTGFSYQISVVDATPGEKAQEYVRQYGKQSLDAELKNHARELSKTFSKSYEAAVMTEVAEGKISEIDAISKIANFNDSNFEGKVARVTKLREDGLLTDQEARIILKPFLGAMAVEERLEQKDGGSEQERAQGFDISELYNEEGNLS